MCYKNSSTKPLELFNNAFAYYVNSWNFDAIFPFDCAPICPIAIRQCGDLHFLHRSQCLAFRRSLLNDPFLSLFAILHHFSLI